MSPNVGNFVHDLVEMAKAMETLPTVQADLSNARGEIDRLQSQVQRLELRLIDRATEIDGLNAKVREAEKARDDAETMFLETDERLSAFRHLVSGFSSNAANLLRAQEPIVEQPPQAVPSSEQGQSESSPIAVEQSSDSGSNASSSGAVSIENVSQPITIESSSNAEVSVPTDPTLAMESSLGNASEGSTQRSFETHEQDIDKVAAMGERAADPTAPSTDGPTPSPASAAIDGADTVADAHGSAPTWAKPQPYAGKKWSEVTPRVYNYLDWERGGGSSENFNL
jgi:predicted  nucleic acid-binding Zn-ribbon protein